ncbi:type II secretion system F family protein [Micromonospora sp. NPDC018662]|uniref:type II secretion system F family protein n=1 Tax=Micromonospora sp. NPDC018662 TaxID=3364238 RepID=UPI0037973DDA
MTGQLVLVVVLLAGAAVTVGWPVRAGRARQRALLDPGPAPGRRSTPDQPAPASGGRGVFRTVSVRRALPAAALLGGGVGAVLGGPVAALALAVYGTLAARAALRRRTRRAAEQDHRCDLDRLGAVAADLRAGLPAGRVLDDGAGRIARLARAAVRLADRTGAPLADLLERIEADARAADRGLAAAAAQAAGARATAWLLAALPLGGIGLGYAIGVDPVAVLLHTPVGGGSAVAAVLLQVGGLLWAERLGAGPGRAT